MSQSTEQFVEIADIRDNVVILKNGSLRAVIEVSAINFELRSEDEQIAIVQNFQRFLNSVDFPLEIVMTSRRLNIDDYLKLVSESINTTENELIKIQAMEYSKFINELSELANIMEKRFFVVVSFYVSGLSTSVSSGGFLDSLKGVLGPIRQSSVKLSEEYFQTAQNQLLQRVELIYEGLIGLGVRTNLLKKEELMSLFYGLYNHDTKTKFGNDNNKLIITDAQPRSTIK